ncbi:MAG TPA: hypothetical protein VNB94_13470 [Mycobacteriales bacterium]|nr:hypothetical protein [Mycobacteriales bacterium]
MTASRPPRLRPVPSEVADGVAAPTASTAEAELLQRLGEALAALPQAERAAAVVAFGLGEGTDGVATELSLSADDADALTRSALQLLRAALADADTDSGELYSRLTAGRRTAAPAD